MQQKYFHSSNLLHALLTIVCYTVLHTKTVPVQIPNERAILLHPSYLHVGLFQRDTGTGCSQQNCSAPTQGVPHPYQIQFTAATPYGTVATAYILPRQGCVNTRYNAPPRNSKQSIYLTGPSKPNKPVLAVCKAMLKWSEPALIARPALPTTTIPQQCLPNEPPDSCKLPAHQQLFSIAETACYHQAYIQPLQHAIMPCSKPSRSWCNLLPGVAAIAATIVALNHEGHEPSLAQNP